MLSLWRTSARRLACQSTSRALSTTPTRSNNGPRQEALDVFNEAPPPPPARAKKPAPATATAPAEILESTPIAPGLITAEELSKKDSHAIFDVPPERDPILHFLTNSIMKHGRYSRAQKVVSEMLLHIHTLTRSPPIPIVREAVFKASPAVRVASTKAGARAIVRPVALSERQRTGQGIRWLLEASNGKPGITLQERLAKEMIAAVKGESGALNKKEQAHKSAMVARGSLRVR